MYTNKYYLSRILEEYEEFFLEKQDLLKLNSLEIKDILKEINSILNQVVLENKTFIAKCGMYNTKAKIITADKLYKHNKLESYIYNNTCVFIFIKEKIKYTRDTLNRPDLIINVSIYNEDFKDNYLNLIYDNL